MKKLFNFICLFSMIVLCSSCYERIDAGCEGIKVNLYGSDKGVDDVTLITGAVWYNPIFTAIYEYPTYVQTVDYPSFTINAKDGSSFEVDPTISLKIIDGKSASVFKKYRKSDIMEIINSTLFNYVKNAFRIQLNNYTTDELVSKREEFERSIEEKLSEELEKEGFHLEQMTSGLKYPQSLISSINAKNEAVQVSLKIQNEVAAVKAQAEKDIAKAEGEAKALRIKGDAESEYNRKISASLSTLMIQKDMVNKWDGKTPVIMSNGGNILDLSKFMK